MTPIQAPIQVPVQVLMKAYLRYPNIKRLVIAIGTDEKSVKEMMKTVGLKNHPNFLEYSLTPAITEGLIKKKYPNSPHYPRQKYLLTMKGLAAYGECKKQMLK